MIQPLRRRAGRRDLDRDRVVDHQRPTGRAYRGGPGGAGPRPACSPSWPPRRVWPRPPGRRRASAAAGPDAGSSTAITPRLRGRRRRAGLQGPAGPAEMPRRAWPPAGPVARPRRRGRGAGRGWVPGPGGWRASRGHRDQARLRATRATPRARWPGKRTAAGSCPGRGAACPARRGPRLAVLGSCRGRGAGPCCRGGLAEELPAAGPVLGWPVLGELPAARRAADARPAGAGASCPCSPAAA